jgi:2-oxo-3-hexenedioate decarboxylase
MCYVSNGKNSDQESLMTHTFQHPDIKAVSQEVLAAWSGSLQVDPFTSRVAGLSLQEAYQVTALLRQEFEAQGQVVTGRKIGFTNREMWAKFGVTNPIWGYATSKATYDLAATPTLSLAPFSEPRIEPEIMFGLGSAPKPGMTDKALFNCIEWLSLGFEIVQSIYPGWRFGAADTIANNGLHAALCVGQRHALSAPVETWLRHLGNFTVNLICDGRLVHRGGGSLVLGSPFQALRHLVDLLANDTRNPPLSVGEIISTGTLTLAAQVRPGETWTASVNGIPLEDISMTFE